MKVADGVVILEQKIDDLLRDERVLKFLAKNINSAVMIQQKTTKKLEFVLRIADIPTIKGLRELFDSVNNLEKESMRQKMRIQSLETELEQMKTRHVKKTKSNNAQLEI